MTESTTKKGGRAAAVVRVASMWVLAGALFKLFLGSPRDLPPSVQSLFGDMATTFRVAIAVELCVVILCLFRPRLGWIALSGLLIVFDAVLVPLVAKGAASCGCFGKDIPIAPWMMMVIDTVLLLAILTTKPWSAFEKKPLKPLLLLPLFAIAIAAPIIKFKPVELGEPGETETAASTEDPNGTNDTIPETTGTSAQAPIQGDFYEFKVDTWEGSMLHDTDLAQFVDADAFPIPCHVVFFSQTCEVCKDHLETLVMNPITDRAVVLIKMTEKTDTPENEVTKLKPQDAILMELQVLPSGYGPTPPFSFDVDDLFMVENFAVHTH